MKLNRKLFYSHLLVVLVSIFIAVIVTTVVSRATFLRVTEESTIRVNNTAIESVDVEVINSESALDVALMTGLGIAIVISTLIASGVSLILAKRITQPLTGVIEVSKYIAEGHYEQRVAFQNDDEIGELVQHFNEMAQSLNEVETTRRQLLSDVSHELSTPLTSIVGIAEGLLDKTLPADEANYQIIHDEALRLQRLVRDVQYLSTMEAAAYRLNVRQINLNDLIETVISKLLVQYQSKDVRLNFQASTTTIKVCVDEDRMTQVLINVLGNALQYTAANGCVSVHTLVEDNTVEIIIRDNGIGIDQADLKKIFDRFYRVDKSRNRASGGSGIGLTIARYIIEAHTGSIWVESDGLNQGSQFHIKLPTL